MTRLERIDVATLRKQKEELEDKERNAGAVNAILDLKEILARSGLDFESAKAAVLECAHRLEYVEPKRNEPQEDARRGKRETWEAKFLAQCPEERESLTLFKKERGLRKISDSSGTANEFLKWLDKRKKK